MVYLKYGKYNMFELWQTISSTSLAKEAILLKALFWTSDKRQSIC